MAYALPLWIIGAPLVLAIIDRMRTPRVTSNDHSTWRTAQNGPSGANALG